MPDIVQVKGTNLAISLSGAVAVILGFAIAHGVTDHLIESVQGVPKYSTMDAPFDAIVTTKTQQTTQSGNTISTRTDISTDVEKIKSIQWIGMGLLVIGWILVGVSGILTFAEDGTTTIDTGATYTVLPIAMVGCALTVADILVSDSLSSAKRIISHGSLVLFWIVFAVVIGFSGPSFSGPRFALAVVGTFFILLANGFMWFDRRCCDLDVTGTKLIVNNQSGSIYSLGMPLYAIGWMFVIFAMCLYEDDDTAPAAK